MQSLLPSELEYRRACLREEEEEEEVEEEEVEVENE